MKTITINRIYVALFATVFSVLIYSCQKENSLTSNNSSAVTEQAASDYSDESAQADASFDDVSDLGMVAADEDNSASQLGDNGRGTDNTGRYFPSFRELRAIIGDCATVTVSPNDSTYPKTITIDFGDSCRGYDGKVRRGKIVLHLTGPIRRPGSVMTITFVNFYLNRTGRPARFSATRHKSKVNINLSTSPGVTHTNIDQTRRLQDIVIGRIEQITAR